MTAVPFDTLKLAERLQTGGFSEEQAKAASSALAEAMSVAELATASGLKVTEQSLQQGLRAVESSLKAEIVLLKWMLGFVLTFQVGIFLKLFIH